MFHVISLHCIDCKPACMNLCKHRMFHVVYPDFFNIVNKYGKEKSRMLDVCKIIC